jgi:hypothetical protein
LLSLCVGVGRYVATILDCEQRRAKLRFEAVDGLPAAIPETGETGGVAPDGGGDADAKGGGDGGALDTWVPFESIRPLPSSPPFNMDAMCTLGCLLEMHAEGGWWEVELIDAHGGRWPPALTLPSPSSATPGGAATETADACVPCDAEGESGGGEGGHAVVGTDDMAPDPAAGSGQPVDVDPAAGGVGGAATYTVRLVTAPSESVGVYECQLAQLRPGWLWKLNPHTGVGRWGGRWATEPIKAEVERLKVLGLPQMRFDDLPDLTGPASKKRRGSSGKEGRSSAIAAPAVDVRTAWPVGVKVEVVQADSGLSGAWFEGEVIGHNGDKCLIRYDELHEGDDSDNEGEGDPNGGGKEKAEDEWPPLYEAEEPGERIRPKPKPDAAAHVAWAKSQRPGAALDLFFDGGWWEVELIHVWELPPSAPPTAQGGSEGSAHGDGDDGESGGWRFTVKAVHYEAEHVVGASRIRPPHAWRRETRTWGLRPPPQIHIRPPPGAAGSAGGSATAKKGQQKGKRAGKAGAAAPPPTPGEPSHAASQFAVGTKRKGVDGQMWESEPRGKYYIWVPLKAAKGVGRKRSLSGEAAGWA